MTTPVPPPSSLLHPQIRDGTDDCLPGVAPIANVKALPHKRVSVADIRDVLLHSQWCYYY